MATFDYASYAATVAAAQNKNSGVKVGFFKLADGCEALVRFNVPSLEALTFASIHRVKRTPEDRFAGMSISCLNPLGKTGECPLCAAVEAGDDRVQKVGKRVYVQLLVSYKDKTTGTWSAPAPVIWERPAGFYKEVAAKLNNYGDLTQHLFKVTRTGASLDTVYSIDYAVPAVFKPEMIPADFSAFANFDIKKHSYWVKTPEECEEYLRTGKFPEAEKPAEEKAALAPAPVTQPKVEAPVTPTPAPTPVVPTPAPVTEPVKEEPKPTTTSFGGFSF